VRIKAELEKVKRTRSLGRQARKKVPFPVVALVGYTNAGKSTLFNRLTESEVLAKDLLFATLDPTMRGVKLPQGTKIILSDTVGFIADLPTELVAAFRATLEEVLEADVIVHVRDGAHDEAAPKADVLKVGGSGRQPAAAGGYQQDRPGAGARRGLLGHNGRREAIAVSAMTGTDHALAGLNGRDAWQHHPDPEAGRRRQRALAFAYRHSQVLGGALGGKINLPCGSIPTIWAGSRTGFPGKWR
jgi:GTP-binding protein HflX